MPKISKRPVVVLGAGGHARTLLECLQNRKWRVKGFLEKAEAREVRLPPKSPKILGDDSLLDKLKIKAVFLANGIGSVKSLTLRREVFQKAKEKGFSFVSIIHSSAIVSPSVQVGEGSQIFAGAIVQHNVTIGSNCIVNTGAIIDHDCQVGDHVHIATGATLSGGIKIESGSHIGAGSVLLQGITVGKNCVIGAGAVVISNVKDNTIVVGNPARIVGES